MRRNPGEADRWVAALRSGQASPAALERRISELTIALEDALAFGYPADQVEELRGTIRGLEGAREETAGWEAATKSRFAVSSAPAVAPARQASAPPPRKIAAENQRGRDSDAADLARRVAVAEEAKAVFARMLEAAKMHRDPYEEILYLEGKVREAQDEIDFVRHQLGRIGDAPKRENPGGRKRARKAPREVADVRRDIAAGRIDMTDVVRRIDNYRRVLAEVLANDPAARERIASLIEHIRGLEDVVLRLRSGPDAGVA